MRTKRWPEWWEWELSFRDHARQVMRERDVTEVDVREMLEDARDLYWASLAGRWVVLSRWRRRLWEVVVEPDAIDGVLVVITVYEVD